MEKAIGKGCVLAVTVLLLSSSGCGQEKRTLSETEKQLVEMNDPSTVDRSEGAAGMKRRVEKLRKLKKELEKENEEPDTQLK
ncbi:hypothetical protein KAR34_07180 [bacterium]|nr:hypothetical protein [bacterium]